MPWYYADQGQQKGPVEDSALDELVRAGIVRDDTLVWQNGMPDWQPHASVRGPRSVPMAPYVPAAGALRYAGFWIRFLARLIDAILLNIVFLLIRIPFGVAMFAPSFGRAPMAMGAMLGAAMFAALLSILASACYEIFFIAERGATLGKMVFGLKVVRADGSKVSTNLSVGRYLAQILSSITLGIGYIMAGFDDQKRALHDRICETRVIYSK